MKKSIRIKIFIGLGFFLFSLLIFISQQNSKIYNATLGQVSYNYERRDNGEILQVAKPFSSINKDNLLNWDAVHYMTIRNHIYDPTCHGHQVLQAFYPLFSIVWKISMIGDSVWIFIFNYLLFILALIILSHFLKEKNLEENYFIFSLSLLLPTTVMFYLPYAEALFLLTFVLAVAGLFQKKYWLFFIGALAFSMTRPACLIYIMALIIADVGYFIRHKNSRYFIKEITLKVLPFISGFFIVTLIQYLYTGSWTAYWDSLAYWPAPSGLFNPILDWSVEGFGLNAVAIFIVAIPALIYSIIWGIKSFQKKEIIPPSLFEGNDQWIKEYIFNSSVLFIAGNLVYTFLTSGNVINGFARYTMAVPGFYIVWFLLQEKLKNISLKSKIIGMSSLIIFLILFLDFVQYGRPRIQFAMGGLYLSLAVILFYVFNSAFSSRIKWTIFLVLLIPIILWHTYLFNIYLCQAWIYM